jgi:hypothetical protein
MSPRATLSPSRWSPEYFKHGENEIPLTCPNSEPLNHKGLNGTEAGSCVRHNTAVEIQSNFFSGTMPETSKSESSRSTSPSLSFSTSHSRSRKRSRSRSRSREGGRVSFSSGVGRNRLFHNSASTVVSRRTAAGPQCLTDNNNQNSGFLASHENGWARDLADHGPCDRVQSFTADKNHGGWRGGRNYERQMFNRRSATAHSPCRHGP